MKNKLILASAALVLGIVSVSAHAIDRTVAEVSNRNPVTPGCTAQSTGGTGGGGQNGGWSTAVIKYTCGSDVASIIFSSTWTNTGTTTCTVYSQSSGYTVNGSCNYFFIHANF